MEIKPLNQCLRHGCYSEPARGGLCSAHYTEMHGPVVQRPVNEDVVRQAQEMIRKKAVEMPDLTPKVPQQFHDRRGSDPKMSEKYPKYYKAVPPGVDSLDVYAICKMFGVTDAALSHALKKIMLPGERTGGKTRRDDIKEARDTLTRYLELNQ